MANKPMGVRTRRALALLLGAGLGALTLASGPILPLVLFAAILIGAQVCKPLPLRPVLTIALPIALAMVAAWMVATYFGAAHRDEAVAFIREWSRYDRRTYRWPNGFAIGFVARNFFLSREKTYTRKLYEALLAYRIEGAFSKDEILELYMNKVYLGEGAYGFAQAARTYFGKPLTELTLAESAM
ncbi:transglycosylase domain-containing protein, partial [Staphylococcus aureus]|nr:transglycosylase domain-containing protein [Staphylococcus aureus]